MTFNSVGNVVIPTDEVIFFRRVGIPPTRYHLHSSPFISIHLHMFHFFVVIPRKKWNICGLFVFFDARKTCQKHAQCSDHGFQDTNCFLTHSELSLLCARLCGKWTPVVEAGNTMKYPGLNPWAVLFGR